MEEEAEKKRRRCLPRILRNLSIALLAILFLIEVSGTLFYYYFACERERTFCERVQCGLVGVNCDLGLLRALPSDEEMITNFHEHRADFERLVHIYRQDLSVPTDVVGTLLPTPNIAAMMDRIDVTEVHGDGKAWLPPDPYSKEAQSETDLESASMSHRPSARKFSGVIFSYPKKRKFKYLTPVHKDYYFIPLLPMVESGKLKLIGEPYEVRIVPDLNRYPPDFLPFECVCKQIEQHWFIRMCREKLTL